MRIATTLVSVSLGLALLPASVAGAAHHEAADREMVVTEAVELKGKVVAIDRESRTIVVEGQSGLLIPLTAPKEGKNFEKISLGDDVTAVYYESVGLAIQPKANAQPAAMEAVILVVPEAGATPGGVVADTVRIEAVVLDVDAEARIVTLDVPERGRVELKVREGVDLTNVKVGEQVVATHTTALAIEITPPAATPAVSSGNPE